MPPERPRTRAHAGLTTARTGLTGPDPGANMAGMLFRTLTLCLLLPGAALAACPAPPDRTDLRASILDNLSRAESFAAGRAAIDAAWRFWRTAPDPTAQELLDAGLQAQRYGDYLRVEETLARLTEYCPGFAEGWNQLAFTYFLQDRFAPALAALDRAIALEPAHFGALSCKGLT